MTRSSRTWRNPRAYEVGDDLLCAKCANQAIMDGYRLSGAYEPHEVGTSCSSCDALLGHQDMICGKPA